MRRAAGIRSDFRDGAAVGEALMEGASYEPKQLQEGEIAYAALAALQNPTFVDAVRRMDEDQQAALAEHLAANPAAALALPGAEQAAALAAGALQDDGAQVLAAGRAVKQAAYDVQHQAWSKGPIADKAGRLARTKALSNTRYTPGPSDTLQLVNAAVSLRDGERRAAVATPSPVVQRGLALAAMAAMGRAGEENTQAVAPLLAEPQSAFCLKMAKLNLFQCLAVAGPHYEDVFCLGQHALLDTAKCVSDSAAPPAERRRAEAGPPPLDAGAPRSVMVPIAIASAR
jgi:hypothetical protein